VGKWDVAALDDWKGDRAAFEVVEGGTLLPVAVGAITRSLPGCEYFKEGMGGAVSLEVACQPTSAHPDAAAVGMAIYVNETRIELVLSAPPSKAEVAISVGGDKEVLASKDVARPTPDAGSITLRLELSPDHAKVTAFVGTSADFLRIVGHAEIPPASGEQVLRCGLVAYGRSRSLMGPFHAFVLANDRLCVGNGPLSELARDATPEVNSAARPVASGGSWTFSDDLSAGDRIDIQAMLAANGLASGPADGPGDGLTFHCPESPGESPRLVAKLKALEGRLKRGHLENEAELEAMLDQVLLKAGVALDFEDQPKHQNGASQWTVSTSVSGERRAEILALIGAQDGISGDVPQSISASSAEPGVGPGGWTISASLSAEKREQLLGLIGT
jgi:hypothetical protein